MQNALPAIHPIPEFVLKRNGKLEPFTQDKITRAIFKAAKAVGGKNQELAESLSRQVIEELSLVTGANPPEVEQIQDCVERVLIKAGHSRTARTYILYREKRSQARNYNALAGAIVELFSSYLSDTDWRINENANVQRSINGLNNYVREIFTKHFWLESIYPQDIRDAHEKGEIHIHDLGFLGPYCSGWDLEQILREGFGGIPGKVASRPAKHLRSFLGQVANATFTAQGECAGAQAWSSFDTYCAPFIRKDNLTYEQVKQALQEFIFNLNVPTRVGFQCPFSNLTFDLRPPATLAGRAVIIGGEQQESCYGEYAPEMEMFNSAFCEVMLEGDADGRVFTFPIPTLNVTSDFPWESAAVQAFLQITCKYGIPYFANYVNSDLSPEDAVSMCCRLRLDTSELRKRGGGLFGSNPMTGSLGVVTLNLARIGYLATDKNDFFVRLGRMADIARNSLEIKRKEVERLTESGLYPYAKHLLRNVFARSGEYWKNHFSTIGIIGMHEALLNYNGSAIYSQSGQEFAQDVLLFLREKLKTYQTETGNVYNLEATPAEGTSYRLAERDKSRYPDIVTSGEKTPYYTNSTQLPASFTDDLFEAVELQSDLQSLYTGGTVFHAYLGEQIEDTALCAEVIQCVFQKTKLPYLSITPTFSICKNHGYLKGKRPVCPECQEETEVYSRVVGYLRPMKHYNCGKKEEFGERIMFETPQEYSDRR